MNTLIFIKEIEFIISEFPKETCSDDFTSELCQTYRNKQTVTILHTQAKFIKSKRSRNSNSYYKVTITLVVKEYDNILQEMKI